MGNGKIIAAVGLGILGLGAAYFLLRNRGNGFEIYDLSKTMQDQDPNLTKLYADALAAAAKAQEALNDALNAADDAGVGGAADNYTNAEGNNDEAQTGASSNPTDTDAAAAAAAAQAAADAARLELETSFASQLDIADRAAASAKECLRIAYDSWKAAYTAYTDYQAYIAARTSDGSRICGYLWKDGGQRGASKEFRLGDTVLRDFNDCASSWTLFPGYKFCLYEHGDFSGRTTPWIYGDNETNSGDLSSFNDCASAIRCEGYPHATIYVNNLSARLAEADRIKLEVTNCQTALNSCIERVQSIIDNIRVYNVLSVRVATSESSLQALRSYVASIKV